MLTAAVITVVSGCGGNAEAEPAAKPKQATVAEATAVFQDAVVDFDLTDGCPPAAEECWDKMLAVMKPARELRTAMNAQKDPGPEFYSEAYALIDEMELGAAVGEDVASNRPQILGSAHELSDWLDKHPVK
ncbi:hypothetical protein AB0D73_29400 [Streptomyces sp. NPDC048215]|uniref:hypothetical protein n=1 Tax=Streptomyces sp. NPDC048215 TaxID=3156690 RepID=UPI00340ED36C